ncbi:MAG: hypothetical protein PHU65_02615 [Actinomycetota bacterium]|jgi:hypothetical protein|nr:hypothetical protein [Actinomycetota bacterium]
MNIDEFCIDAESFLGKIDKEYYLHFAGLKKELNLKIIYDEYPQLFDAGSVNFFKDLFNNSKGGNKKKAKHLLEFSAEGYMGKRFAHIADRIANNEASSKIQIDDKEVSFRYSDIMLSNEEDSKKRSLIEDKRLKTTAEIFNPDLVQFWESMHTEAESFGYKNYADMFMQIKGFDFYKLEKEMDMLVSSTDSLYREHMGRLFQNKLNISLEGSRASDFAFIKRAKEFDMFFKKEQLIPIFKDTMRMMGIDIDNQSNIIMDVDERENKSPRAFCCTVKVPSEIYLVVMPTGGQDDYQAMFHEGGHAEHFANTKGNLDIAYRYLGDSAVTEGYAFCLENLAWDRNWLIDVLGMNNEAADDFTYFLSIINLFFLRRYAGKLKYELLLHSDKQVKGKDIEYSHVLTDNLIMKYFPENYLKDVDENFYCTNYIRAWIFEAQVKEYMLKKFGYKWYKNRKAGDFLKEIWSYGMKYSPEEVLEFLDYKGLDINYLLNNTINLLKGR